MSKSFSIVSSKNGFAFQIHIKYFVLWDGATEPRSYEHLLQGTNILISKIIEVKNNHENWSEAMVLKGGICAYSSGVERVIECINDNDFADDVIARSQYYKSKGF